MVDFEKSVSVNLVLQNETIIVIKFAFFFLQMRLTQYLLKYEFKFFKRFVDHEMNKDWTRRQWDRIGGWKTIKKKYWYFGEHRPWTEEFKRENGPFSYKRTPMVQPIKDWSIFKGDRVSTVMGFSFLFHIFNFKFRKFTYFYRILFYH